MSHRKYEIRKAEAEIEAVKAAKAQAEAKLSDTQSQLAAFCCADTSFPPPIVMPKGKFRRILDRVLFKVKDFAERTNR